MRIATLFRWRPTVALARSPPPSPRTAGTGPPVSTQSAAKIPTLEKSFPGVPWLQIAKALDALIEVLSAGR
jgi:hypothetical protein